MKALLSGHTLTAGPTDFQGETSNNIVQNTYAANTKWAKAVSTKWYWGNQYVTLLYSDQNKLLAGLSDLNQVGYDPEAKGILVKDPANDSKMYYFNRDISGNLYMSIVDLNAQGFSPSSATPWGALVSGAINLGISPTMHCGRHFAFV